MSVTKVLVTFLTLLFTIFSWAGGSRVGNGGSDRSRGKWLQLDKSFEVETPLPFIDVNEYPDGIRIESPVDIKFSANSLGNKSTIEKQKIILFKLEKKSPEFTNLTKGQTLKYFDRNKWHSYEVENNCIVAKHISNEKIVTAVVTWGNGEGYLASADNQDSAKKALEEIVKSTKIEKSGCSWK